MKFKLVAALALASVSVAFAAPREDLDVTVLRIQGTQVVASAAQLNAAVALASNKVMIGSAAGLPAAQTLHGLFTTAVDGTATATTTGSAITAATAANSLATLTPSVSLQTTTITDKNDVVCTVITNFSITIATQVATNAVVAVTPTTATFVKP